MQGVNVHYQSAAPFGRTKQMPSKDDWKLAVKQAACRNLKDDEQLPSPMPDEVLETILACIDAMKEI